MKRQRKKHETPRFPWQQDILMMELRLVGKYGLRNKRELWKAKAMASRFRKIARSLLAKSGGEREKLERELLQKLYKLGLADEDASLDDVLDLTVEDLLERRLQTIVFRQELAKSIHRARQLIAHGHIAVGDRRVTCPGYLVKRHEEDQIRYWPYSPLTEQ